MNLRIVANVLNLRISWCLIDAPAIHEDDSDSDRSSNVDFDIHIIDSGEQTRGSVVNIDDNWPSWMHLPNMLLQRQRSAHLPHESHEGRSINVVHSMSVPRRSPNISSVQTRDQVALLAPHFHPQPSTTALRPCTTQYCKNNLQPRMGCRSRQRRPKKNNNRSIGILRRAIQCVNDGMAIRTATTMFDILASFLRDHLYGTTCSHKRGGKTLLMVEEEEEVKQWVFQI